MENAGSIVSKFGQVLVEELQEIRGVGDKIVHLRDELASMNAVLRMLAEADEDCVDHLIREWTKQVRELASDSEDCVDIYKLRVRRPFPWPPVDPGVPMNSARRLVGHAKLLPRIAWLQFEKLFLKRSLAADLKAILARMVIISERRARYGIDREALHRSASFAAVSSVTLSARALRPSNNPDQFIGLTDQVNNLSMKLRAVDADKDMKVFSIVGFGGLGKTTLAMEVCRELEVDFPHQAQVSVSLAFDSGKDLEGLLKHMLHQMVKPKSNKKDDIKEEDNNVADIDNMDVLKLTSTLQNLLRDKRYLIVIDDVWTIPAWEAIRFILPTVNNHNSRIIVTTRVESVAKACSSVGQVESTCSLVSAALGFNCFVHPMEPLKEEVSKKLFISRVFGSGGTCPEELKDSMVNILRKCGGMPLAIVSMASLLASYRSPRSREMWERICNSISYQLEINPTLEGMRQILTLSYSHLPHHLKICTMYFSIFPEDYEIKKKWLLRRWIAEGMVAEKRGLALLEVAESYFDELLSTNMIVPASFSIGGRVKTCRVHDMMLEVMVSISLEANFVSLVGVQQCEGESHGKIRRLSIQSGSGPKIERSVKHVRSLSMFHPEGHQVLERLDEFALLRVLDLESCQAVENRHMKYVCRMFLLKFLNLNGTRLTEMPDEIGKLVHLQTLSIRYTLLRELPETVTELEKLEFLYYFNGGTPNQWRLPRGLGRMKALRVVDSAFLGEDVEVAREIGELTQLSKLDITICHSRSQVLEEFAAALNKTNSLRTLFIRGNNSMMILNAIGQITSPPPLLQSILLHGDMGVMPKWVGSLAHLVKMDITNTKRSSNEILGILCKLPNLLRLTLGAYSYTDEALVASTNYRFPVLKQLSVTPHAVKQNIITFEQGSMAKLEKLEVQFGYKAMSLFGIEHLPILREVLLEVQRSKDLHQAVAQLKSENHRRPMPNRFKVVARYYREEEE